MKNLTRKLMLSIVAIALVVIALGTSTFAWFTLSNKASVGQFNAEVTAGEGMELSLDQATWYSSIPSSVIQAQIKTDFGAVPAGSLTTEVGPEPELLPIGTPILTAVTTTDLNAFKKLKADQTGWETAIANVDYIKIKIYVRAVKLNTVAIDSITVTGTPANWTSDVPLFIGADGYPVAVGGTVNVSAANGARIGIRSANATATDSTFVYENAGSATNTVLGNPQTLPTIGQAAYFEEKNGINPNSIEDAPTSVIGSVTSVDPAVEVLTLGEVMNGEVGTGNYTGQFDLFVWFEGFDPDTYDSILKMPLNIKMSFIGSRVTP